MGSGGKERNTEEGKDEKKNSPISGWLQLKLGSCELDDGTPPWVSLADRAALFLVGKLGLMKRERGDRKIELQFESKRVHHLIFRVGDSILFFLKLGYKTSVADPDLGSGAFVSPGSGMG